MIDALADLSFWHMISALVGCLLSLWAMSLSAQNAIGAGEPRCLRGLRRVALAAIGGGLLWSLSYGFERDWQPWPPFLLLCIGVDLWLTVAVVAGHLRQAKQMRCNLEV